MATDGGMENGVERESVYKGRAALHLEDDFFGMKKLMVVVFLVGPGMVVSEGCIGYALIR